MTALQLLLDALAWADEHQWWVVAGVVVWMVLSVGFAVMAGPVIGAEDRR